MKKMYPTTKVMRLILIGSIALILTSCATGYHPSSITGGFEQIQLSNDSFMVGFSGNGYTSSERSRVFAMRRAAELTKEKGFKYFTISNSKTNISRSAYRTPVNAETNSNYNVYGNGSYGNINGSSNTTITGGNLVVTERPSTVIIVKMYHKNVDGALDADIFLSNFQKK